MNVREYNHAVQLFWGIALLGLMVVLSGCDIVNIHQPHFARPGEIIVVDLRISGDSYGGPSSGRPMAGVQLPTGWSVVGNPNYRDNHSNSGTLTYESTRANELHVEYGGTWWAGEGPWTTWPSGMVTATGTITLQAAAQLGDYQLTYVVGCANCDVSYGDWGAPVEAHINVTSQRPVRSGAVTSIRDYPTEGVSPSVSLARARSQNMPVVYHYLGWDTIEVKPGHYRWNTLRDILKQVEAYNQKVILRIYNPPPWRMAEGAPVGGLPANNDDLKDFMQRLTEEVRYGSGRYEARPEHVTGYVIWNEPNIKQQWGGQAPDAAAYMAMLKAAYEGAKAGDPAAVIISAPLAPTADIAGEAINDLTYLGQLYDNGLADYVDYVGMNGLGFQYSPDYDPGAAAYSFTRLKYLHDVMVAKGDTIHKVWALEVGWLRDSQYDLGDFNPYKVSDEQQIQYVARAFRKAETEWPWLDLIAIWNLDFDRHYPPTSNFYWYSLSDWGTYLPIILKR
jgi:hypothetical protein